MLRPTLLLCLTCLFAACDAGSDSNSACGTNGGTVTATVDGLAFTASCITAARTADGVGFVADDRNDVTSALLPRRELSFDMPTTPGTYRLGGSANALAYYSLIPPTGSGGTPARFAADSGAVVIESVNGRRYKGRFNFRTGSKDSNPHDVSQGFFDVTLQGN